MMLFWSQNAPQKCVIGALAFEQPYSCIQHFTKLVKKLSSTVLLSASISIITRVYLNENLSYTSATRVKS